MKKANVKIEKSGVKMSIEFSSNDVQVDDEMFTVAYIMRSLQYTDFSICGVYVSGECVTSIDVK